MSNSPLTVCVIQSELSNVLFKFKFNSFLSFLFYFLLFIHFFTGEWNEWSDCPVRCERSIVDRSRTCLTPSVYDATTNQCGKMPLVQQQDCLDLVGCAGARYYLADQGVSCSRFCKDTQGITTRQLMKYFLPRNITSQISWSSNIIMAANHSAND